MSNKTKAQLELELRTAQKRVEDLELTLKNIQGPHPESPQRKTPSLQDKASGEEELRQLFEFLPVGISILDAERKVVFQNSALLHILHLTLEGLATGAYKNRRYLTADGSPMPADGFASTQAAQSGQAVYDVETGIILENGKTIWTNVSAVPVDLPHWKMVIVTADITARKQVGEKLRESEEKFSKAFHASHVAITITRAADSVFVDVNDVFLNLLGYEREEILGHTPFELNIFPDLAALAQVREQLTRQGNIHDLEMEIHTRLGETREVLFSVEMVLIGSEIHNLTTMVDITERKVAEDQLRESEEKYTLLFEKSTVPTVLLKLPEVTIWDINEAGELLTGFTRQEMFGKTSAELGLLRQEERKEVITQFEKRGTLKGNERRLFNKSGEECIVLFNTTPLMIGGQQYAITTMQDITELRRAEGSLISSREGFSKLFDSNPAALIISSRADGRVVRLNAAYTRMIGYTADELTGKFAKDLNIYADLNQRQEILHILQTEGAVRDHEVLIRVKSGEIRTLIVYIESIHFEGEDCLLSALVDITERKHMEGELRRSNAELEQFAYIASHDLQEPLRTITGMVQLLQKRYQGQIDERADEYIGHAVESAARMQALIRDLLAYSRVDRKNQPIVEVNSQDCLKIALKNLRAAMEESQAEVTAEDLPTVHADPTQLVQLFQNLVGNSLKFRRAETPRVQISAMPMNGFWQFAVRDNGIGIEPQYFERIFLVFQRLHNRRQYQGTGIGLALCKKIIERHGGAISVESQPGAGSTFYFTLPIRSES